jgi:hypothetical protein
MECRGLFASLCPRPGFVQIRIGGLLLMLSGLILFAAAIATLVSGH